MFASNLLEHFHSPEEVAAFLDRMRETLAPGGVLALMGPNFKYCARDYFDCADHLLALTHVSVQELCSRPGYKVTEVVPRFLPFSFRSRLPASPALTRLYLRMPAALAAPGQAVPDPRDARVTASERGAGQPFPAVGAAGKIADLTESERSGDGGAGPADMSMSFSRDVVIVGGCGHVGLPLGLVLADAGLSVTLYDRDADAVDRVRAGQDAVLGARRRRAARAADRDRPPRRDHRSRASVAEAEHVVLVVGTPVDEHLNPDPKFVLLAIEGLLDQLRDGQHVVLRSTVYPRRHRDGREAARRAPKRTIDVSFCPERIAEGKAIEELRSLPQIVSARTRARACGAPRSSSARSRRRSCTSTSRRPSSPSSSRTRGATSSSRPRTSCS